MIYEHTYHKINSIFKRDRTTNKFITKEYSCLEFSYLKNLIWVWTEKVDGTNIRIIWNGESKTVEFRGKSNISIIPKHLIEHLTKTFTDKKMFDMFGERSIILYGEGYGHKIQKGDKYLGEGVSFVLFDAFSEIFFGRGYVEQIAERLEIEIVPIIGCGTINKAIEFVSSGFNSTWTEFGTFESEGLVIKPELELMTRIGCRVIAKIKCVDFKETL